MLSSGKRLLEIMKGSKGAGCSSRPGVEVEGGGALLVVGSRTRWRGPPEYPTQAPHADPGSHHSTLDGGEYRCTLDATGRLKKWGNPGVSC